MNITELGAELGRYKAQKLKIDQLSPIAQWIVNFTKAKPIPRDEQGNLTFTVGEYLFCRTKVWNSTKNIFYLNNNEDIMSSVQPNSNWKLYIIDKNIKQIIFHETDNNEYEAVKVYKISSPRGEFMLSVRHDCVLFNENLEGRTFKLSDFGCIWHLGHRFGLWWGGKKDPGSSVEVYFKEDWEEI